MLGFFIDLVIIGVSVSFLAFILALIDPVLTYGAFLIFFFYTPVCETMMNGQTFGKRMMRTQVVSITGKEPSLFDYLIRWAFRMVDIYFSMGSLAVIFVSTSARSQRLGGILSNTMVVSLEEEMSLALRDILRIEDRSVYVPEYAEAHKFSEEEMLTVKSLVDRYTKYKNKSHAQLVEMAAEKCAAVLGLSTVPGNKLEFLRKLVKDYVVITRS
jgi:uncharacterized RDD family membrane protein YckC